MAGSPSSNSNNNEDEIKTLFVSGLPPDVKEREIHNLFRPFQGYEGAAIRMTGDLKSQQPVVFVTFATQETALASKEALQGLQFDPDSPVTLRIELAKSNSKTKRRRTDGQQTGEKRLKPAYSDAANYVAYLQGQGGYMHGVYNDIGPLWNPQSLGHNYLPQEPIAPYLIPGKSGGLYAPCSTLFIGNLGPTTSEKELTDLFKRYGGLQKLKIHNKEGALVCFAEFQNVQFSTYAMNALQGYTLESSDRAMRIEFAKTRMGDSKRALEGEQHHQKFNSSSQ